MICFKDNYYTLNIIILNKLIKSSLILIACIFIKRYSKRFQLQNQVCTIWSNVIQPFLVRNEIRSCIWDYFRSGVSNYNISVSVVYRMNCYIFGLCHRQLASCASDKRDFFLLFIKLTLRTTCIFIHCIAFLYLYNGMPIQLCLPIYISLYELILIFFTMFCFKKRDVPVLYIEHGMLNNISIQTHTMQQLHIIAHIIRFKLIWQQIKFSCFQSNKNVNILG